MIVGVGIDVVEVERLRAIAKRHERFLARTFAPRELKYAREQRDPYRHLAARFAAKEAAMKALGTGWRKGVDWRDVVVAGNGEGKPELELAGHARDVACSLGVRRIHVSLSHTGGYACAQVVLEA